MKKAGFRILRFGVESGSDKVLQRMKKDTTTHEYSRCLALCRQQGIQVRINLMTGFPGESLYDVVKTGMFVWRNRRNIHHIGLSIPCDIRPGSMLHERRSDYGIQRAGISPHWISDGFNTYRRRLFLRYLLSLFIRALNIGVSVAPTSALQEWRAISCRLYERNPDKGLCYLMRYIRKRPWSKNPEPLIFALEMANRAGKIAEMSDLAVRLLRLTGISALPYIRKCRDAAKNAGAMSIALSMARLASEHGTPEDHLVMAWLAHDHSRNEETLCCFVKALDKPDSSVNTDFWNAGIALAEELGHKVQAEKWKTALAASGFSGFRGQP